MQEQIRNGSLALDQELDQDTIDKLAHLLGELRRWGQRVNLTAILEPERMVSAHVLDSLSVRPMLKGPRVIDVGTGAGFPGLPLAIVAPEASFELLDSNGKKLSFVRFIIAELGLTNAQAVKARAEDYAPASRFDTVIARALASTDRLLAIAGHLVKEDGVMLALKGKHPAEELDALTNVHGWKHKVAGLSVPGLASHARHVVILRRD